MYEIKPWWQSKTLWVNGLTLLLSIITVIAASEVLEEHEDLVLSLTGIAIPVINIILRWLTSQPITSILGKRKS